MTCIKFYRVADRMCCACRERVINGNVGSLSPDNDKTPMIKIRKRQQKGSAFQSPLPAQRGDVILHGFSICAFVYLLAFLAFRVHAGITASRSDTKRRIPCIIDYVAFCKIGRIQRPLYFFFSLFI